LRIAALLAKAVKIEAAGPLPFGVHADHPAVAGVTPFRGACGG